MKVGRDAMVERAKASLFHRAVGYSLPSEKVFQSPDVTAAKMILQAYDTEDVWRDKRDVKSELTFSLADLVALSMADREAKARAATDPKLIEGDSQKIEK